jgi:ParB-like chromosome segregation protein Spo0J
MHMTEFNRAPLTAFRSLHTGILFGEALNDVKHIERSIARFGLMAPFVVTEVNDQLIIIDGKKRLAALKRMSFSGTLPHSLSTIPYISVEQSKEIDLETTSVLSAFEIYEAAMNLHQDGAEIDDIAETLYLCRRIVMDFLSLSRLYPKIRQAFFRNVISFEQARAYASLPDQKDQIALLATLGPFADAQDILKAIRLQNLEAEEKTDYRPAPAQSSKPSAVTTTNYVTQKVQPAHYTLRRRAAKPRPAPTQTPPRPPRLVA